MEVSVTDGNPAARASALLIVSIACWVGLVLLSAPHAKGAEPSASLQEMFVTSDQCLSCHNNLSASDGEDVSIAPAWRASMMANASRDPYWQAAVRRESLDHPSAVAEIENECSACHMPMTRFAANAAGEKGKIFAHLAAGQARLPADMFAADGVSCALCHQISEERAGTPESFNAGFHIDVTASPEQRRAYGPYLVDAGPATVMQSATGFVPTQSLHVQQSEVCATCHTLFTHALGPAGEVVGRLPEQVPFLEWKHSAYVDKRSCQSCHMPLVESDTQISSVMGQPRAGLSRHSFHAGNFFMIRMLNRYRSELAVEALPLELERATRETADFLRSESSTIAIENAMLVDGILQVELTVQNLAGHKLPSAYPSRRAWIRFVVRNRAGETVFESGGLEPSGMIRGNDNDRDGATFEPHYELIDDPGKVQIYEAIMAGPDGSVTTGLLTATHYLKDNRLLPHGFDKRTASEDIAVRGEAFSDADFVGGCDRVRYQVDVSGVELPLQIEAELWYQPIGFRWANNLRSYQSAETERFVRLYDSMAESSAMMLTSASAVESGPGTDAKQK
jgi:hypothetical protein